jgi:hypothetical protein
MNKVSALNSGYVKRGMRILLSGIAGLMLAMTASAHLMVAQHGTLNIVSDGAFMVLSLPVSAFEGVDDNADGKLSAAEFTQHRLALAAVVKQSVLLHDKAGPIQIQGLLLSSESNNHGLPVPVTQIVAMGRFVLRDTHSALRFENKLYGKSEAEKVFKFTASNKAKSLRQEMELTPQHPAVDLFPPSQSGLLSYLKSGVDHLLASWN